MECYDEEIGLELVRSFRVDGSVTLLQHIQLVRGDIPSPRTDGRSHLRHFLLELVEQKKRLSSPELPSEVQDNLLARLSR